MIKVPDNIAQAIRNAANKTGVDYDLLVGIAYMESSFDPAVINGTRLSETRVSGLFQITGKTWKSIRKDGVAKTTDINEQAYTAALLIKKLSNKYNGDRNLIAIAYNGGEGISDQLKGKEITYDAIKNAVQKYSNQAGFGPNKVKEIFDYPRKLNNVLGDKSITTIGNAPINPLKNVSNQKISTTELPPNVKYDNKYSILENFTMNSTGIALDRLNHLILDKDISKTYLVRRLRARNSFTRHFIFR